MKEYDIVLKEKPFFSGLSRPEIMDMFDMLNDVEAYPIELPAKEHESSAMGFISTEAADLLDYDYTELRDYIASILDDMENESETCEYNLRDITIWLSR